MLFEFLNKTFSLYSEEWVHPAYFIIFIALTLICMIGPYLLGSLNFAVIISKIFYHDDIRKYGSGNAGATNMLRTYGKGAGAATMILDMLKCVVSVFFCMLLLPPISMIDPETGIVVSYQFHPAYIGGLACILGHIFPCFYKFKGGKGVASVAMMMLCTSPILFLIMFVFFAIIVIGTKYVSLGSVMCMALYPILLNSLGYPIGAKGFPVIIALILAALIIFMHRENIKRIMNGTESKISFSKKSKVKKENDDE